MFGRDEPAFFAFDVLALEGRDLRELALIERKKILRRLIPRRSSFVLFADFIEARGCHFYRLVCARDLEGIVAKWKAAPHRPDVAPSSWIKIKNPGYSSEGSGRASRTVTRGQRPTSFWKAATAFTAGGMPSRVRSARPA
jgi:ATP-dependent DNA ligase